MGMFQLLRALCKLTCTINGRVPRNMYITTITPMGLSRFPGLNPCFANFLRRWAMIAYWVTIIVIGVLARSWTKLSSIGGRAITESRVSAWYKSHVSVPMAFGSACPRDVGWATVPPRDQAIAAMLFAAVNIVLSCVGYKIFEGNL